MSDTKQSKAQKRPYKVGGVCLSHDVRVRIDEVTYTALTRYATRNKLTRAAAARKILTDALESDK